MGAEADAYFSREIGATPAEYLRALRMALPEGVEEAPDGCTLRAGEVVLELRWCAQPARRIALLELPVLRVDYRFRAGSEAAQRDFLLRLDRATQRGGG